MKLKMTQEEKMLLIKDLSARLPYAVKVEHTSGFSGTLHDIAIHHMYDDNDNVYDAICYTDFFGDEDSIYIEYFKPYLFPLSSMTTEQRYELHDLIHNLNVLAINGEIGDWIVSSSEIDWYNKNHFDYRGLIEKGLAIDATGKNIY
jgi:hypothetical protein